MFPLNGDDWSEPRYEAAAQVKRLILYRASTRSRIILETEALPAEGLPMSAVDEWVAAEFPGWAVMQRHKA